MLVMKRNIVVISDFKNWCCLLKSRYQNFWNIANWNISLIISGNWWNCTGWQIWIFEFFSCWCYFNWNIGYSIFNYRFSCCFVCYWNIVCVTNFNSWMTNFFFYWFSWNLFIFKDWLEYFRDNIQWDVSNVSNFKSINCSIFIWTNCRWFIYISWCLIDWNIIFSFNDNWLNFFVINWNIMTIINFDYYLRLFFHSLNFWNWLWNLWSRSFMHLLIFKYMLNFFWDYI